MRFAAASMEPALRSIWMHCFGEDERYADWYFTHMFDPREVLVYMVDGNPAAMLTIRDVPVSLAGKSVPGAYIFAVATHPDHQGKRLSTALLEETHRLLAARGAALSVLAPAGESLFAYYAKRGYATAFTMAVNRLGPGDEAWSQAPACAIHDISIEEIARRRRQHFSGSRLFVDWSPPYLEHMREEARFRGGGALGVGQTGYCFFHMEQDVIVITELVMPVETGLGQLISALRRDFPFQACRAYRWASDISPGEENTVLPYAMVKWYDNGIRDLAESAGGAPYIAHIMD